MKYVKKIVEAIDATICVVTTCLAVMIQFPFAIVIYEIRCDNDVKRSNSVYIWLPFIGFFEMWSAHGKYNHKVIRYKFMRSIKT